MIATTQPAPRSVDREHAFVSPQSITGLLVVGVLLTCTLFASVKWGAPHRSHDVGPTDEQAFAMWLRASQNPAACAGTLGIGGTGFPQGFGAAVSALRETMLASLQHGHIFSAKNVTSVYANPRRCPARSLECYFKPLTTCTGIAAQSRVVHEPVRYCNINPKDVPGRRVSSYLAAKAKLRAVHSITWVRAQLTQYILRPNAALEATVAQMERRLGLHEPDAYRTTVAVHVRHGDKASEARLHTFEEYVRQIGYIHAMHGGLTHVLLGSDDPSATDTVSRLLQTPLMRNVRVVCIPAEFFVSGTAEYRDLADQGKLPLKGKDQVQAYYESRRRASLPAAEDVDEGMSLSAQIVLMARCKFFIGAFSSNLGQTVYLLRHGKPYDHFHDMDGNIFYACSSMSKWPFGGGYSHVLQSDRSMKLNSTTGLIPSGPPRER